MDVTRTRDLLLTGRSHKELVRKAKGGGLVRVRHGAYARELAPSVLSRHRQLIAGTYPTLEPEMVLSHVSDGVLHGLPAWESMLDRVTAVRLSTGHGSRRRNLHVRLAAIPTDEVCEIDGYRVTSIERTAIDLACILRYQSAVAVVDAALHAEADLELIVRAAAAAKRRHGIGTARAALAFADGRSESVAESISRVRMAEASLPVPEIQVNVFDEFGRWIARTDFGWLEHGVLGEFDGKVKYLGSPEQVARAVMQEKAREAAIRELGWVVVRWDWSDLADRTGFRARIESAFRQATGTVRGYAKAS